MTANDNNSNPLASMDALQRDAAFHSLVWSTEQLAKLKRERDLENRHRVVTYNDDGNLIVHAQVKPIRARPKRHCRVQRRIGKGSSAPLLSEYVEHAIRQDTAAAIDSVADTGEQVDNDMDDDTLMALALSASLALTNGYATDDFTHGDVVEQAEPELDSSHHHALFPSVA